MTAKSPKNAQGWHVLTKSVGDPACNLPWRDDQLVALLRIYPIEFKRMKDALAHEVRKARAPDQTSTSGSKFRFTTSEEERDKAVAQLLRKHPKITSGHRWGDDRPRDFLELRHIALKSFAGRKSMIDKRPGERVKDRQLEGKKPKFQEPSYITISEDDGDQAEGGESTYSTARKDLQGEQAVVQPVGMEASPVDQQAKECNDQAASNEKETSEKSIHKEAISQEGLSNAGIDRNTSSTSFHSDSSSALQAPIHEAETAAQNSPKTRTHPSNKCSSSDLGQHKDTVKRRESLLSLAVPILPAPCIVENTATEGSRAKVSAAKQDNVQPESSNPTVRPVPAPLRIRRESQSVTVAREITDGTVKERNNVQPNIPAANLQSHSPHCQAPRIQTVGFQAASVNLQGPRPSPHDYRHAGAAVWDLSMMVNTVVRLHYQDRYPMDRTLSPAELLAPDSSKTLLTMTLEDLSFARAAEHLTAWAGEQSGFRFVNSDGLYFFWVTTNKGVVRIENDLQLQMSVIQQMRTQNNDVHLYVIPKNVWHSSESRYLSFGSKSS